MEVIIDGQALQPAPEGETLQDILEELYQSHMDQDRAFKEVWINGDAYDESVMGEAANIGRASIQRLEIETVDSRTMALFFLDSAAPTVEAITQATAAVAEMFRVGDSQDANEQYLTLLESMELLLNTLQRCRDVLELDLDAIEYDGVSAQEHITRLSNLTEEMLQAQENDDWVLLADILEFDLGPALTNWKNLLPKFREAAVK